MTPHTDKKGFGVAASPFNGVKLELGVILALELLLWLAADSITADLVAQLWLLGGFGVAGMVWLIVRTRHVLRQCQARERQLDNSQDQA